MDESVKGHYARLLGLGSDWRVVDVDLALGEKRVTIRLEHSGGKLSCPECGAECFRHDHAGERTWRHLDTMQFETLLVARVPRCQCAVCGVKTITPSWTDKHSRFTLLFEAFAIDVLRATSGVSRAAALLGLSWDETHAIMRRAVERGLARRELTDVKRVGLDEKSFGKGQDYVTTLTDLDGVRVLEVVPGRTETDANHAWKTLPESQREAIEAAAIDMSAAYENSVRANAPNADIVHDRFHVSKLLNEAVDQVRKQEHKSLKAGGGSPPHGNQATLAVRSRPPRCETFRAAGESAAGDAENGPGVGAQGVLPLVLGRTGPGVRGDAVSGLVCVGDPVEVAAGPACRTDVEGASAEPADMVQASHHQRPE